MIEEYFEFIEQVKKTFNDMLCHTYYQSIEIDIPNEFLTEYLKYEFCYKLLIQYKKRIKTRVENGYQVDLYIDKVDKRSKCIYDFMTIDYKIVMCLWQKPSNIQKGAI